MASHMATLDSGTVSEARRMARFLDLPKWKDADDLSMAGHVSRGLPARTVSIVVKKIDPEGRFFHETDLIPKSTWHRRRDQDLTKDESERVWALSKLFLEVLRIYHDDSDRASRFLVQPHPLLGNRSPIELAKESIVGADVVMNLLARADAGVAA